MKDTLQLLGHVHGQPNNIITSSYSWPRGVKKEELGEIIAGFVRAFTPIRVDAILDNIPGVWYFGREMKDSRREAQDS